MIIIENLTRKQLINIENWIYANARPLEVAKWNMVLGKGTDNEVLSEMLKYQNPDGGFGNSFEPDILLPQSSAIASAEAILTLFDFGIDVRGDWFKKLLDYFVNTRQNFPSYWEYVPQEVERYPHPPWWNYQPDTKFTPNPCAIVAAAMLLYGDTQQKEISCEIAEKCIQLLKSDEFMGDHDIYCLQRLLIALLNAESQLVDKEACKAMERRILAKVSNNPAEWMNYVPQPLDLVDSPNSPWFDLLKNNIHENVKFWLGNLNNEGVWPPNFSWGIDSTEANTATKQWLGYIAVKRVRILKAFGCIME